MSTTSAIVLGILAFILGALSGCADFAFVTLDKPGIRQCFTREERKDSVFSQVVETGADIGMGQVDPVTMLRRQRDR